jgi:hypothetical protein
MTRRSAAVCAVAIAAVVSFGCTPAESPKPADVEREFEVGPHRVRLMPPDGWDVFDQGLQKRFRKAEAEVILRDLGSVDPLLPDMNARADWGLKELDHDGRRDVKSRRVLAVDGREAMDVETWNRLSHTWPQRFLLVLNGDHLLALYTPRLADAETVKAYETIRDSLHFLTTGADSGRR